MKFPFEKRKTISLFFCSEYFCNPFMRSNSNHKNSQTLEIASLRRATFFYVLYLNKTRLPGTIYIEKTFFQDLVHACEASLCQFGELLNVVYFEQKVSSMVAFWVRSCFVIPVTVITILKYLRWKKAPTLQVLGEVILLNSPCTFFKQNPTLTFHFRF